MSDKHSAIAVKATSHGMRAVLASRPRVQVIDIISTWRGERQDVGATARYFGIGDNDVRAVLRYYADHRDEIDQDLKAHLDAQENYKRALQHREARAQRHIAKDPSA